ncbi:hypothetical protein F4604DRAFT_1921010 [Suillus subluteus]|nr:hypothetical protein F4604DRAFT_1921010 [Suillus subluteus]
MPTRHVHFTPPMETTDGTLTNSTAESNPPTVSKQSKFSSMNIQYGRYRIAIRFDDSIDTNFGFEESAIRGSELDLRSRFDSSQVDLDFGFDNTEANLNFRFDHQDVDVQITPSNDQPHHSLSDPMDDDLDFGFDSIPAHGEDNAEMVLGQSIHKSTVADMEVDHDKGRWILWGLQSPIITITDAKMALTQALQWLKALSHTECKSI